MKELLIPILLFFVSFVRSAWKCPPNGVTGYCKDNDGWGPSTFLCPAHCGSGGYCTNSLTGSMPNVISALCDTTLVDCTNTLSAISHSFNRDLAYDGTDSNTHDTNTVWTQLFSISNSAYCPLLTCGVAGGRHSNPSLHYVTYEAMGMLEYRLDLVYGARPFYVECSNSHDKNTKT